MSTKGPSRILTWAAYDQAGHQTLWLTHELGEDGHPVGEISLDPSGYMLKLKGQSGGVYDDLEMAKHAAEVNLTE